MRSAARHSSIKSFFQELEKRYGHKRAVLDSAKVVKAKQLTPSLLEDLFSHRIVGIHVPSFFPETRCQDLSQHFLNDPSVSNWAISSASGLHLTNVMSVGLPMNVAIGQGAEVVGRYFAEAVPRMQEMREVCGGASPMDALRLQLDELWRSGATVSKNKEGQAMLAGVGRIMLPPKHIREGQGEKDLREGQGDKNGFCHVDELGVLNPKRGLFSANVYLKPADQGGEIDLWNVSLPSRWEVFRNFHTLMKLLVQDTESQKELREWLGPPSDTVKPGTGDLLLLCAQRPHAVRPVEKGMRISLQTFIEHETGKPLGLDG